MFDLNQNQEILLQRYHDNDLNFIKRYFAKKLLVTSEPAREYFKVLSDLSDSLKKDFIEREQLSTDQENVSLWDRISYKIDLEENKKKLYLSDENPLFKGVFAKAGWFFGGITTGALASALVVYLFTSLYSDLGVRRNLNSELIAQKLSDSISSERVEDPANASIQIASSRAGLEALNSKPVAFSASESMEVDWMRSAGRLRLIPDKKRQIAMIWIKQPLNHKSAIQGEVK